MAKGYNQFLEGIVGKVGAIVVTTNGQQTVMRKRVYRNTSDTPAQQQARANITGLAHLWATLNESQIAGWHALGRLMPDKAGTRALSSYQAFNSVNGLLLACGKPPVADAPAAPAPPASLPPVMLDSSLGQGANPFVLTIGSAAYNGLVQVFATAPAAPGRYSFGPAAYKLLLTLPGLTAGATPLAAPYVARFGTPAVGRRIAVRLVPVGARGFRGLPISVSASVTDDTLARAAAPNAAAQAAPEADKQRKAA